MMGSSPLTRGKPILPALEPLGGGLIPAHAGKTLGILRTLAEAGAHPRSRGENFAGLKGKLSSTGSSPLTRGKHCRRGQTVHDRGLIPAHAGKTDVVAQMTSTMRAHPRSRGENLE